MRLASYGARSVTGIDISETAIAQAQQERGHCATFHAMDAMHTTFADGSYDLVVGRAILHHLEWESALAEIARILRPGGHALFMEPLGDNPAARLARAITPKARTRDERPLGRRQLRGAGGLFGTDAHVYAGLVSTPLGMLSSLVSHDPGNAVMRLADRVDRAAARTPLRYWMRVVVLAWTKAS